MSFIYRLLFTRDDDLDLLQLVFLGWVVFTAYAIARAGAGVWEMTGAAWGVVGSVFATLAITGTPIWLARLLAAREKGVLPSAESAVVNRYEADRPFYGVDAPREP